MRWERLFAELEAQSGDLELDDRDALVEELRDGDWAETPWRALLGGRVELDVLALGRVEGEVVLANAHVVHLRGERFEHVVSSRAVLAVVSSQRRADPPTTVTATLGWRHVFRALRQAGDMIRIRRVDGSAVEGTVIVVGRDFVRLRAESGHDQVLPFDAVAVVSGRT
jgi:hypothetical protein